MLIGANTTVGSGTAGGVSSIPEIPGLPAETLEALADGEAGLSDCALLGVMRESSTGISPVCPVAVAPRMEERTIGAGEVEVVVALADSADDSAALLSALTATAPVASAVVMSSMGAGSSGSERSKRRLGISMDWPASKAC